MSEMDKEAQEILETVRKEHGEESIMLGRDYLIDCDAISTNCISLDIALGVMGMPYGRVVEIFGPEGSGKTTLTLHLIASAQKAGKRVAFIDAEHALDPEYATTIGVNIDNMLFSQPDCGEQALNIVKVLTETGKVGLIVIDSVAALVPQKELDGLIGDKHIALQAQLMSQSMRMLTHVAKMNNTCIVFINQIRDKMMSMGGGSPETTPGGRALKFYSSVRLDIRRIGQIKKEEDIIGNLTKVKIIKNKVAPPFKIVTFELIYGKGINKEADMLDLGCKLKLVNKRGNFMHYNDINMGNGKYNCCTHLRENPELSQLLEAQIYEALDKIS